MDRYAHPPGGGDGGCASLIHPTVPNRGYCFIVKDEIERRKDNSVESAKVPEIFAAVATILGVVAAVIAAVSSFEKVDIIPRLFDSAIASSAVIGAVISVIGVIIAVLLARRTNKNETE